MFLFNISLLLLFLPVGLSCGKYRPNMVMAFARPMVMSATCHVSTMQDCRSGKSGLQESSDSFTLLSLAPENIESLYFMSPVSAEIPANQPWEGSNDLVRMRMAQANLEWGEAHILPHWFSGRFEVNDMHEDVHIGHLSFRILD